MASKSKTPPPARHSLRSVKKASPRSPTQPPAAPNPDEPITYAPTITLPQAMQLVAEREALINLVAEALKLPHGTPFTALSLHAARALEVAQQAQQDVLTARNVITQIAMLANMMAKHAGLAGSEAEALAMSKLIIEIIKPAMPIAQLLATLNLQPTPQAEPIEAVMDVDPRSLATVPNPPALDAQGNVIGNIAGHATAVGKLHSVPPPAHDESDEDEDEHGTDANGAPAHH